MKYFYHPLNSPAENKAIKERLDGILWNLEQTPEFTAKDRIAYLLKIATKTRASGDLYLLLKAVGIFFLRRKRPKSVNSTVVS